MSMDIGHPGESNAASRTEADAAAATIRGFYCGECGSWGAHDARCVSCGYDFRADPVDDADPV